MNFNANDLKTIEKADEKVVLIKVVPDGKNKIAWVTFKPFQKNQVTWDNAYYLYASLTDPVEDNQIRVNSSTPAQARYDYTFNSDNSFSIGQHNPKLGDGQYGIVNDMPSDQEPCLTFGMAQTCSVNSKENVIKPINAEVVPALHFAKFTPSETVLIFLASDVRESAVHNNVMIGLPAAGSTKISSLDAAESVATALSFSSANQTITVVYSASLGKFIQQ